MVSYQSEKWNNFLSFNQDTCSPCAFKLILLFGMLFCLLICKPSYGQNQVDSIQSVGHVFGVVPSKQEKVNGWAVRWLSLSEKEWRDDRTVHINGLYTNLAPDQLLTSMLFITHAPFFIFKKIDFPIKPVSCGDDRLCASRINGLALGFTDVQGEYTINGGHINAFVSTAYKLNGVSVALIMGSYSYANGLIISGLMNGVERGSGVQLGLYNVAYKFNGVQIGLWNRIGDRAFPIVNWHFEKRDKG